MNDDDYMAVLREELDEITAEVEQARTYREKRRRLVEVLKEERKALEIQKEERIKRSEVLLRLEKLEETYEAKQKERKQAMSEVAMAVKSCNRLLIATGRPPLDEPLQGRVLPKDELRKKKKEEESSLSKSLPALSLTSPLAVPAAGAGPSTSQHTRSTIASGAEVPMASLNAKLDILGSQSCHSTASTKSGFSKGSKIVVSGILKNKNPPSKTNLKRPAVKGDRRRSGNRGGPAFKDEAEKDRTNDDETANFNEKKQAKVDNDGDMTNFLDAIGYYSPTEED